MEDNTSFYFSVGDGESFVVSLWIASAHTHHADSCTFVKDDFTLIEIAFCYTFKEVYQIALDTEHHTFRFWISHAAVVFNHLGLSVAVDESEEDEAFVDDPL